MPGWQTSERGSGYRQESNQDRLIVDGLYASIQAPNAEGAAGKGALLEWNAFAR
jgi:hypothetical protein